MNRLFLIVLAAALAAASSSGQIVRDYQAAGIVPVPSSGTGGQAGGVGNPANLATLVANGTDSDRVGDVYCYVYLNHPRVADLSVSLSHCGTTINLFAGLLNQNASVNGVYVFKDSAQATFATAVYQAQGIVPPGTYQPIEQMSTFIGSSASGPWTLTIADFAAGVSGTAGNMTIEVYSGYSFGGAVVPSLSIPDGVNGNCVQPVTQVVNVPGAGQVGILYAALGLNHTYTSDLTIVLSHAGVSATIMSAGNPLSGANLASVYTFQDAAPTSWQQIVGTTLGNATVPPGFYRPLTPFSAFRGLDQAGPWYLTICDSAASDVGTLSSMTLTIATSNWDLQIWQPQGPASVTLLNKGGTMGNSYANLVTVAPGAFPHGWLHGLDIGWDDLVSQVNYGSPYFGPLSPCGTASTTVQGPIPSGLTVQITSLEIDQSGSITNFKQAFSYTTP